MNAVAIRVLTCICVPPRSTGKFHDIEGLSFVKVLSRLIVQQVRVYGQTCAGSSGVEATPAVTAPLHPGA